MLLAAAVPWVVDCGLDCVHDGGGDRDLFPLAEHRGSITVRPLTLNGKPWNTGTDPDDTQDEVDASRKYESCIMLSDDEADRRMRLPPSTRLALTISSK
jgi:hypothetical protein